MVPAHADDALKLPPAVAVSYWAPLPIFTEQSADEKPRRCALYNEELKSPLNPAAAEKVSVSVSPMWSPFVGAGLFALAQASSCNEQFVPAVNGRAPATLTEVNENAGAPSMPKSARTPPPFDEVYFTASVY